ncbi:hypothetical protein NQ318_000252 [Aromia moschata]|uniref:MoaB/Mog domain-containing protein n=1 Tax=Aromia moschata TaxID=1265417 RepID=A0AAV8YVR4_9CUCU|nr:hypothetical protein NQ318_000252 [Aromia moschata]
MASKVMKRVLSNHFLRRCFCSVDNKITTAGIIVIGDEILKGEVADTNSTFLAVELHLMGLKLEKISVIGDDVKAVCGEVRHFAGIYDYVLTSGGIGPTHDDITYEAVALAFNQPLVLDPLLKEICMKFYNTTDVKYPGMKLAYIPKTSKLTFSDGAAGLKMAYPNVSIKNVYMFPGIPELLVKSFSNLKGVLFKSDKKFYTKSIYFNITEDKIVAALEKLVKEYPNVQFGSYPKLLHRVYKVKVTIESCCEESTDEAYNKLMTLVPRQYIVNIDDI